jgi:NADH-quinone oxidoreductase subunit J
MILNTILLIITAAVAFYTVVARSLLKATIGLAITSAVITILMFNLDSPLAAVFELSVCTGLITVVFASAIALTKPLTHKETIEVSKNKLRRYWYLPVIMVLCGIFMAFSNIPANFFSPQAASTDDVKNVLWNMRQLDLFGQIIIMLAGAFSIAILFKEVRKK